jgi:uracil-DNA glycosylase
MGIKISWSSKGPVLHFAFKSFIDDLGREICFCLSTMTQNESNNSFFMESEARNEASGIKSPTSAASKSIKLDESWQEWLAPEFQKDYMKSLRRFLKAELSAGKKIFPKGEQYFAALNTTAFDRVKVVILGQDPYHGLGQAHGLCFSVQKNIPLPPSLVNIYKELESDLGIAPAKNGNLQKWAEQGVLLLNSVLTVEMGKAAAHQGKGWEQFTDRVIQVLNENREGIVFLLWGSYAQKKAAFVDRKKHLVLEAPHPSPLSSYRGFFGSKPFSKINKWLVDHQQSPIDWRVE